jgi:ribosomal protein S18 acetylase RimI-like enzyme
MHISVRAGSPQDVELVARLHADAIGEGFLSSLGRRFLGRLYARIVSSPNAFLAVADDPTGRRVVGFVAGAYDVSALYREFLRRDGVSASLAAGPRLVRAIPRTFETLRYGLRRNGTPAAPRAGSGSREAELLALAVAPEARGQGAGAALVDAFLCTVARGGASTARVVVGSQNHSAIAVYRKCGFIHTSEFSLHAGVPSTIMRAELTDRLPL